MRDGDDAILGRNVSAQGCTCCASSAIAIFKALNAAVQLPFFFLLPLLWMNENKPPVMQCEPKIGPPRSVRIGSFCENYVIWSALAHNACVTVRSFGWLAVSTPTLTPFPPPSKVSDISHSHSQPKPVPLDSIALDLTSSDWDLHV